MEYVDIEVIAEAMAILDGKGNKFRECKADAITEYEFGHYNGYMSEAYTLISIYKRIKK